MHIYTDPVCIAHEVPEGHPERSDRLRALLTFLDDSGISKDHPVRSPQAAPIKAILRAHPQTHVDFLTSLASENLIPVDPDT